MCKMCDVNFIYIMSFVQDVADKCKTLGINALHVRIRGTGGNKAKTPGPGGQSALRAIARAGIKIGRIEVCTDQFLLQSECSGC